MRISLTSDTHYGFSRSTQGILESLLTRMAEDEPDIILHAGDWSSTKHQELWDCLALFRKYFPNTNIISALSSNHDVWKSDDEDSVFFNELRTIEQLLESIQKAHDAFGIKRELVTDSLAITTCQSWYRTANPPSNDHYWMPGGAYDHYYMLDLARKSYDETKEFIKNHQGKKRIVVSHFTPFNYRYGYTGMCGPLAPFEDMIALGLEYLCLGHSHQYQHEHRDGCLVLNAGSDYDKPRHITFEV